MHDIHLQCVHCSAGGHKVTYRVKKAGQYGGYEIVTAESAEAMSRAAARSAQQKKG
jgi:hypothetical protein